MTVALFPRCATRALVLWLTALLLAPAVPFTGATPRQKTSPVSAGQFSLGAYGASLTPPESPLDRLQEELAAAQQALSQALSRNERYQQEIVELRQQASKSAPVAPGDYAKRLTEARQGLTKAIDTINQQNARIGSLREKVQQLETANQSYAQFQEKVRTLEEALARSERGLPVVSLNPSTSDAASAASKATGQAAEIAGLRQQLQQAGRDLAQARQTIAQLEQQSAKPLAIDTTNPAASLTVLQQELDVVRQQQGTLKQQLKQAQNAEQTARQATLKLTEANQIITRLKSELASAKSKPEANKVASASTTMVPSALIAKNKQLDAELAEARQTINLLSDRLDDTPSPSSTSNTALLTEARQALLNKRPLPVLPKVVAAQRQQPQDMTLTLLLAELYSQAEQDDQVITLLSPVMNSAGWLTADRLEAQRLLGKAYLVKGNASAAATAYQAAVPVDALTNLATVLKKQGQLPAAESLLKAALAVAPNDAQLYFNLGNLYSRMEQLDGARQHYRRAIALDPKLSPALYNLALLEVAANQPAAAKRYLQQYLGLNPQSPDRQAIQALLATL